MFEPPATDLECRILGCLIEKQHTTPDYYPLTANSLLGACNQTSNRHPVVAYTEAMVQEGLESLRQRQLIWVVSAAGSRAVKYEQRLTDSLRLSLQEAALLCVLLLRGPQTLGELRSRSERIYPFADLSEAEAALQALLGAEPQPLVARLPRLPGTKESRIAHLLAGPVELEAVAAALEEEKVRGSATLGQLEEQIRDLRAEITELREAFHAFRAQF